MDMPDKSLVKKRFRRGLSTYSEAAAVQRLMARRLTGMIRARRRQFVSVLEIGAGTGLLTDLFDRSFRWERRIVNDLVPDCERYHAQRRDTVFVPGDAEKLNLDAGSFGLICSNAVFQWLADLSSFLKKLHRASAPDGLLAFSTFGPDNLAELSALTGRGLHYHARIELEKLLAGAGYDLLESAEEIQVRQFSDPLDILKQMRRTGVGTTAAPGWWTPRRLAEFRRVYREKYGTPEQLVKLTWHPIYILAQIREGDRT